MNTKQRFNNSVCAVKKLKRHRSYFFIANRDQDNQAKRKKQKA